MNCCNPMTGQCQQGQDCPVRINRQHTCAELGVCNCPGPDCLHAPLPDETGNATPFDHIAYWAAILACSGATVAVVAGLAGYFVAR